MSQRAISAVMWSWLAVQGVACGTERVARPGDPVTLWGDGLPVEEVARYAGAIPYELTCGVSQRVLHEVR